MSSVEWFHNEHWATAVNHIYGVEVNFSPSFIIKATQESWDQDQIKTMQARVPS